MKLRAEYPCKSARICIDCPGRPEHIYWFSIEKQAVANVATRLLPLRGFLFTISPRDIKMNSSYYPLLSA